MDTKEILRKAALLKRNPQLANVIPNSEIIALVTDVLGAFTTLQKAIEANKLKGDKGEDGVTPIAGKDYPSFEQIDGVLSEALSDYGTKYQNLQNELQKAILRASELTNGKDAEITDELIEEVAQMAYSLIELPDFDTLVSTEITRNSEAIRDALELLQGDDRLDASAIKGLENFIKTVYVNGGGGTSKPAVYQFIRDAIADGIITSGGGGGHTIQDEGTPLTQRTNLNFVGPNVAVTDDAGNDATVVTISGGGSGTVETIVAGTGIIVDDTDPANPIVSATASAPVWGDITGTITDQIDLVDFFNTKQDKAIPTSNNLTAGLDQYYIVVANATFTDPTPAEGSGFTVFVRNGTGTVGGTGYSTAGTIIRRVYHSGAWANYVYQVSSTFALSSHTHTASDITDFDTEVSNNTDVAANTAARHSAVTVTDSSEINFTITGQDITANIIAGSVDETKLDVSTNASLDRADNAVQLTGNETIAGVKTFSSDPIVPDEAYGVGWNGSLEVPTKNALYDKIETITGGSGISEELAIAYAVSL